ncbi:MAG: hypothetical protein P4L46_21485 [Fimbriimonas sp.]|nr:hypothetical protein [Fimbriimonas sp.]
MTLNRLENDILSIVADEPNGVTTERICKKLRMTPQELGTPFESLKARNLVLGFAGLWLSMTGFEVGSKRFLDALDRMHTASPLIEGFAADAVASTAELSWSGKALDRIVARLSEDGKTRTTPHGIRVKSASLVLTPRQSALLARVLEVLESAPVDTPTPHQIAQILGVPRQAIEEILRLGVSGGSVVQLADVVFYTPSQLSKLRTQTDALFGPRPFTVAELRDALGTTRKYSAPLHAFLSLEPSGD